MPLKAISCCCLRLLFRKYAFSVKDASDCFDIEHRKEIIDEKSFPAANSTAEQYILDFPGNHEESC